MTSYESNIDDVGRWLRESVGGFSLHQSEAGIRVVENVVTGIKDRTWRLQCQWDGEELRPNSAGYLEYKIHYYDIEKVNWRTGQMMSQESLVGETHIGAKEIIMRYGTGRPPEVSTTGYIEPSDKEVTDREKCAIADKDGRSFFDLDDQIKDRNHQIISDAFADHLRATA